VNKGHEVIIADNLSSGRLDYINCRAKFYKLNIKDDKLEKVIAREKPQFIYHFAAQVNVARSQQDPGFDADNNIAGTLKILSHALKYQISKVIFASSAAVYGNPLYLPLDESHPANPVSFYGLSKYTAECYIRMYNLLLGLQYTILRFANVYGPRQQAAGDGGVIAQFVSRYTGGEDIIIQGNGEQTRDFIYVGDVVAACINALHRGDNQTFNISTGQAVSINELGGLFNRLNQSHTLPLHVPGRAGDIMHSRLDNSKAGKILLWSPRISLNQGLERTCGKQAGLL
jgi:UDP-glucose 4-epimerase